MSPKQILIVAIRLTVIIWIVKTMSTAIPLMDFASDNDIRFPVSEILGVFGFYSIVWLFLWFFFRHDRQFPPARNPSKAARIAQKPCPLVNHRSDFNRLLLPIPRTGRPDLPV